MDSSFKQYTVDFNSQDIPSLYSDWAWLIKPDDLSQGLIMTSFGDLFFKHSDGKIYFLDTLEGAIFLFAESEEELHSKLSDPEIQNRFLSSEAVEYLKSKQRILKKNELYIYVPHPIIAKAVVLDSVQVMSMNVVISLGGQLLCQVGR